jgi:putative AlgH/UPF0301 family transcriptional regulator
MLPGVPNGFLLGSREIAVEPGLWFVFHSEADGILAVDLTNQHTELAYAPFKAALHGVEPEEPLVLKGGPLQSEDALLILHNNASSDKDSHRLTDDFAFKSYRYRLIEGKPPSITTKDNAPTKIHFNGHADFLIVVGFRMWDAPTLLQELATGLWTVLPATSELVFHTPRESRRARALNLIH